jgi:hypothetical protein
MLQAQSRLSLNIRGTGQGRHGHIQIDFRKVNHPYRNTYRSQDNRDKGK